MLTMIRIFLAPLRLTLSSYSHATVIVTNDWLSAELSASVKVYDMSFYEPSSYNHQGAAIDLYYRIEALHPYDYGTRTSVRYSIGNVVTEYSGSLQSTLFSGYVTADDTGSEYNAGSQHQRSCDPEAGFESLDSARLTLPESSMYT